MKQQDKNKSTKIQESTSYQSLAASALRKKRKVIIDLKSAAGLIREEKEFSFTTSLDLWFIS